MVTTPTVYDDMVREHVVQQVIDLLSNDVMMLGDMSGEKLAENAVQLPPELEYL